MVAFGLLPLSRGAVNVACLNHHCLQGGGQLYTEMK